MKPLPLDELLTPEVHLACNLDQLNLTPRARREIHEAEAKGSIVVLNDSTPAIALNGQLLGGNDLPNDFARTVQADAATSTFVLFGLGFAQLARAIRRLTDAPLIIYEPDLGVAKTVLQAGPLDLGDVSLVTNTQDLNGRWTHLVKKRRVATVFATPGYDKQFPKERQVLDQAVQQLVQRMVISGNTYRKRAKTWIADVLANVELLTDNPPFLSLEGHFKGVPAFIVGAGPSLDRNIEELRRAGRKGIVFAVNSSAIALSKRDITPHVIACIESIDISDRLKTIPGVDTSIRAFSLSAAPETLRTGTGPLLPIYEALPQYGSPLMELTGVKGVAICGSVSTAAFSLAHQLGCSPIVLVGQDMAFTGGNTYAGGTGYESSKATFNAATGRVELNWNDTIKNLHGTAQGERHDAEPLVHLPAWGGQGIVESGASFHAINTWFKDGAKLIHDTQPEVRLVNATEGGAGVEGWEDIPLAELLDELPDLDITIAQIVADAKAKAKPYSVDTIADWSARLSKQTRDTRKKARELQNLASRALKAMDSDQPKKINRAFQALDKAEIELKTQVAQMPLIDAWSHLAVDDLMVAVQRTAPTNNKNLQATARASIQLGNDVANAIERSARELEDTLNALAGRLLKTSATTKGNSQCRC